MKKQTFPRGLFDEQLPKKISVDLINLLTKDFLSKDFRVDNEISNYIDDEPVTDTSEDIKKVIDYLVNDNQNEDENNFITKQNQLQIFTL